MDKYEAHLFEDLPERLVGQLGRVERLCAVVVGARDLRRHRGDSLLGVQQHVHLTLTLDRFLQRKTLLSK